MAVDKVAAIAGAQVADTVRPTDELRCMALPREEGEEVSAWLSTQGALRLCFASPAAEVGVPVGGQRCEDGGGKGEEAADAARGGKGAEAADATTGGGDLAAAAGRIRLGSPLPPPTPPALPPLLPTPTPPSAAAAEEEDSIQLGLHALFSGSLPQDS